MSEPYPIPEQACQPDQTRWFVQEVHPHDAALRSYVKGSFSTLRDLDDVVQESYLRVWKRQSKRPITSIKAFLFTVARNLALDTIRHERCSPILPVPEITGLAVMDEGPGVDEIVSVNQEYRFVLEAIDSLPGRCRQVVILRKLLGQSASEAAGRLGISEETVHVHSRRGLRRVQEHLRRHGVIRGNPP